MQENIDEMSNLRSEAEANLKKKEAEIHALGVRIEDEQVKWKGKTSKFQNFDSDIGKISLIRNSGTWE